MENQNQNPNGTDSTVNKTGVMPTTQQTPNHPDKTSPDKDADKTGTEVNPDKTGSENIKSDPDMSVNPDPRKWGDDTDQAKPEVTPETSK